jgi:Flp pilus assembly protein TadD
VEVGPSLVDSKGRVRVTFDLRDGDAEPKFERRASVSVRELSISKEARREYEDAQKALGQRDVSSAVAHLKRALDLAPQFSAAWNHLGTTAYQTGQYVDAETDFRNGLEVDPDAYAPLVNLGGVLINLGKWDEACQRRTKTTAVSPVL